MKAGVREGQRLSRTRAAAGRPTNKPRAAAIRNPSTADRCALAPRHRPLEPAIGNALGAGGVRL